MQRSHFGNFFLQRIAASAFVFSVFCWSHNSDASDEAVQTAESDQREPAYKNVAENGVLFLNGRALAPPIHISASADSVVFNGFELKVAAGKDPLPVSDHDAGDPPRRMGSRRGGEWSRSRWQQARSFSEGNRGSNRSRTQPTPHRIAKSIYERLDDNDIVVAFDGMTVRTLAVASDEVTFIETLLSPDVQEEQIRRLTALASTEPERELWRELTTGAVIPPAARELLKDRAKEIRSIERKELSRIEATHRLDRLAYPMTVIGMILGVIAFGHMLKWSARGITAQMNSEGSLNEVDRFVIVAIRLMLAMSALDLVWTLLAGQAGAMREVNPFAGGFISSPLQLAAFKVLATAVGLGIVYVWRHRQQMQQAAWWICLIFVLLTFRWVMFDSMMT